MRPYKVCGCGRVFRNQRDYEAGTIPLQPQRFHDERIADLELRNCRRCGSTLATDLPGENLRVLRYLIAEARGRA